ncbi:54S ribosomal protein L17 mitochondrial [Scheffersomyces spartinae]|uniref:Large ribosomal subunit protein mL46 n=1 Tax=Scheffersomyces spartinae TaxID=45513 RepID=A0A9P7V5Y3_9ASCO|nr:54S ribosomal protein L17 mitochondrial [Scheffersomyces spartinae]KAG7191840.1 54S ribosomal protein L17 mitochondrial [Scheffersomyces spartinae]
MKGRILGRISLRAYSTDLKPVVSSTLLISRTPIISEELTAFESQYYKYNNELWKRLMWTFPKWYYYKDGTISEQMFKELNPAPVFNNPNVDFPNGRPEIRQGRDRRFKQELKLPKTYSTEVERADETAAESSDNLSRKIVPNSRITKADETKDLTSLERKLARTLYLVISLDGNKWSLPNFEMSREEKVPLHKLAETGFQSIGGETVNYYNVSNTPCHLHHSENKKEYFIKSHILAGKFAPVDNSTKFMWLAKEELQEYLEGAYYEDVKHLFNDV